MTRMTATIRGQQATLTIPYPNSSARRHRLRQILQDQALIRGRQMTLVSGRISDIYFNVKRPLFDPEAASLIAEEIIDLLRNERIDAVGGLAMGAVPIIAAVCAKSFPSCPLRGFFVRKEVKEHGTQSLIEGQFDKGARVVILEDVTTTGGSTLHAATTIREAGGQVTKAITVIDRLEGARENLAAEGIALIALFTSDDFRD
jgi:orotate phosphoribosyltransferase